MAAPKYGLNLSLGTAACAPASVAFQACTVAHKRKVTAFAAGVALEALHPCLADTAEVLIDVLHDCGIDGDDSLGSVPVSGRGG